MKDRIHTKTFGDGGSYPNAVCGYRGGMKGRMTFCRPDLLDQHPDACPDCLAEIRRP